MMRYWLGLVLFVAGVAWADINKDVLHIDAIDVEGGAATLYITPEGKSLLIDTGWPADIGTKGPDSAHRVVGAAIEHGLTRLDYVLITHYHVDHVGGMTELLSLFPVGTVLDHGPSREVPAPDTPAAAAGMQPSALYPEYLKAIHGHAHRILKAGDTLNVGSLHLTVVTSDGVTIGRPLPGAGKLIAACDGMKPMEKNGGEENVRSVGVVMTFGQTRIGALGDLTWNMEKALVCPRDKVGPVDLLIVSHHGVNLSNSPALLQALQPRVAIVDNGAKKGADVETFESVSASPRLKRLWQLHFAERSGPEHNAPEAYIANPSSASDLGLPIEVVVSRTSGFTVTNRRTGGVTETY
jgi:beta-lactamase superfamily II metal-dependent hydrolase